MHPSRPIPGRPALLALLAVLVLALVLAACAATDDPGAAASADASVAAEPSEPAESVEAEPSDEPEASEEPDETVRVRLDGFAFGTDELTVAAGTEVSFLNADTAPHTVTEGVDGVAAENPVINEELAANQATRFTFDEPGTYEITCLFHPQMNMTVIVEG